MTDAFEKYAKQVWPEVPLDKKDGEYTNSITKGWFQGWLMRAQFERDQEEA